MTLLEELESACRRRPSATGRRWSASGAAGASVGRRDRPRPRPHQRPQPSPRRGDGHVRTTAGARPAASPDRTADLDLAVIDVDTGEVSRSSGRAMARRLARDRAGGPRPRQPRRARPARHPGFVSSTARSFRGPRGRRIRGAIEHTAPLPRGSSGGPLVDAGGRLLGINSVRVDGGLILAIAADAAPARADRGARTRRGAEARAPRRGGRAAARGAPAASRRRPARARRRARARGRGGERRRRAPGSSAAT